jgi:hypothetical protein
MMLTVIRLMEFLMKFYSSLSLLFVVLLSACGTFEVSIEQPAPTTAVYTVTPAVNTPSQPQGMARSMIGYTQEGNLSVEKKTTGWNKMVIVSGDVNWIAIIDDGQVIVLVNHPESQIALTADAGNGKRPQGLLSPEGFHHNIAADSNTVVAGISQIQWIPDTHLPDQPLKTDMEGVLSVQQLDGMPTLLVTNTPSVFFLNSSNSSPVMIGFSGSLNTSPRVQD